MLHNGDVQYPITGQIGTVFGYGHQVMHGMYLTTLKVKVTKNKGTRRSSKFIEDTYNTWKSGDVA
ncbi:hypothetical protein [Fortiea contorta]|uniref:hypothetical protein n=1 Tax=Fortiea contorta TaxID=1892405 RepID=UPI00034BFA55|nr:hypothetical protein [Fortiea contorta]